MWIWVGCFCWFSSCVFFLLVDWLCLWCVLMCWVWILVGLIGLMLMCRLFVMVWCDFCVNCRWRLVCWLVIGWLICCIWLVYLVCVVCFLDRYGVDIMCILGLVGLLNCCFSIVGWMVWVCGFLGSCWWCSFIWDCLVVGMRMCLWIWCCVLVLVVYCFCCWWFVCVFVCVFC